MIRFLDAIGKKYLQCIYRLRPGQPIEKLEIYTNFCGESGAIFEAVVKVGGICVDLRILWEVAHHVAYV